MKYKIKKKNRISVFGIATILIIIVILMSVAYSLQKTTLNIIGNVTSAYKADELPSEIVIPPNSTDENGVDRITVNTDFTNMFGIELFRVVEENVNGNEITTSLRLIYDEKFFNTRKAATITLQLQNNAKQTFTNGKVELVESNDPGGVVTNTSQSITPVTLSPGEVATITIKGSFYSRATINNTYYKYRISYDVNGNTRYYYYTLNILPKA